MRIVYEAKNKPDVKKDIFFSVDKQTNEITEMTFNYISVEFNWDRLYVKIFHCIDGMYSVHIKNLFNLKKY